MFDVNKANRPTRCGNCGGTIPKNTKKLRFTKPIGVSSVNQSLCPKCFMELAVAMFGHATTKGDRIFFVIVESDIQDMAKHILGRELNEDELYSVKKGLEHGLQHADVLETAVRTAGEK